MRPSCSTASGDDGYTGVIGGDRVSKASARVHCYGTVDELNALFGLILSEEGFSERRKEQLRTIQSDLYILGSDFATPIDKGVGRISNVEIERVEMWAKEMEDKLPVLQKFILPSGCKQAAFIHLARTVCRRAERWAVALKEYEEINMYSLIYLNRLSDYLFLLSRYANKKMGVEETELST